jgi:Protein of unknown function (DUF1064)
MGFNGLRRKKGNVKVKNATPNEFDGIKFRSKLETYTYKKLKENGISADYEKHKYILLSSFTFHDEKIRDWTYTPDFTNPHTKKEDVKWIIEIKGFMNDVFPVKWKMFKAHLKAMGREEVKLFLPKNQKEVLQAIEEIKKLK